MQIYRLRVVGRGHHDADGASVESLAAQPCEDADSEHDRVEVGPPGGTQALISCSIKSSTRAYRVLKPAVPYWNVRLLGFG